MKKILLAGVTLVSLTANAQKTPVKKPTPVGTPAAGFNNLNDSVSYAIGFLVASFYKQQGIKSLNVSMVNRAIGDVYNNRKTPFNEEQANFVIMKRLNTNPKLIQTIEEGERFLAENKKRQGVKTTASGIQYEVLTQGSGERPLAVDTVTVNYKGTLTNNTVFDQNNGISFPLNGVIAGWTEALQLMPKGSKYKLFIPYKLAYGMNDMGAIPGGSTLIFEVELLDIKRAGKEGN